mgnify:CR=1 FL=1
MTTTCTIIVYHFESLQFLKACIRKVRQYAHPQVQQHIIITEQSTQDCYNKVMAEFGNSHDITIVRMAPLWSGYALDFCMRYSNIKTDYVCAIEPDVFPIHKNWLYLCIALLEEYNFKFVGGLLSETNPATDSDYYYYSDKKIPFYWLSQYLRVGRTADYRELAMEGGFTRFHNRPEAERGMIWGNDDWANWAKGNRFKGGSDDAVIAHCWEDNHRENDKFSFAVTNIMGIPPESGYGRIIDDIIFHFGFHRTSVGVENAMGKKYCDWKDRINNGCDDALIYEMLASAKANPHNPIDPFNTRSVWNGKTKRSALPSKELNKRIEELKNQ